LKRRVASKIFQLTTFGFLGPAKYGRWAIASVGIRKTECQSHAETRGHNHMSDPWAFGWAHVLTLIGFAITILIAIGGFKTFERWRREKIEERRIDIALEALSIAYESKAIFDRVRSGLAYEREWEDMAVKQGETERDRAERGSYYAVLKRLYGLHPVPKTPS